MALPPFNPNDPGPKWPFSDTAEPIGRGDLKEFKSPLEKPLLSAAWMSTGGGNKELFFFSSLGEEDNEPLVMT
jgi:hypothetical protein